MLAGGIAGFLLTEPESDKNREVDEKEDAYFRKKLKQSLFMTAAAYAAFASTGNAKYMFVLALTVDVVFMLMIIGKIKNEKIK